MKNLTKNAQIITRSWQNTPTVLKTYEAGTLDKKSKELLGFVASLVLRCDDCILYHTIECHKAGVTSEELAEAVSIGMLVGGSITIPHVRRAMDVWDKELADTAQK